ncbi:MAG TPA: hypothetical protein DCW51_01715 [Clostridium sp.]|nr:hypothetical protein [Clostridium sp.]
MEIIKFYKNIRNVVKLDERKATENKSLLKFIVKKMYIFKCMDFSKVIIYIEKYFPNYNKNVLTTYEECYSYVVNQLNFECVKYNSYDYVINIWIS